MILDALTKLEAVLDATITSAQPQVHLWYEDYNNDGIKTRPALYRTALNSVTEVTILPAPVQNPTREVIRASIYNADSANATVNVNTDDGTTEYVIIKSIMATLESLHFERGRGWYQLDANGKLKNST